MNVTSVQQHPNVGDITYNPSSTGSLQHTAPSQRWRSTSSAHTSFVGFPRKSAEIAHVGPIESLLPTTRGGGPLNTHPCFHHGRLNTPAAASSSNRCALDVVVPPPWCYQSQWTEARSALVHRERFGRFRTLRDGEGSGLFCASPGAHWR